MMRRSLEERIEALETRKRSLVARQRKERRAADTRRKVLVGSLILSRIEAETEEAQRLRDWLRRELPKFVSRDIDSRVVADLIGAGAEAGAEAGAQAGTPGAAESYAQAETGAGTKAGAERGSEARAQDGAQPGAEDGGRNPATLL